MEPLVTGMIGKTPRMQALFDGIRRAAPLPVGVLVQGESGTGKELVARALHQLSGRTGKFVAVNCGALPSELLQSELFGHERGAFTGAAQSHAGYFEQAKGGTLFLDEITEMPAAQQVFLLRVLETHRVTRVGGSQDIPIDVRVIAASNRDLQHAIERGVLRVDLYFRLLEFPLTIPPLRERRDDIPLLAQHFLDELNRQHDSLKRFDAHAPSVLRERLWPGNVRELRHFVQKRYLLSGDAPDVSVDAEPEQPLRRRMTDRANGAPQSIEDVSLRADEIRFDLGTKLDDIKRTMVLATLVHCGNDKRQAARILGVSLKTIYNMLDRYDASGDRSKSAYKS